eukprot:2850198-Rhodomonas_salina.2
MRCEAARARTDQKGGVVRARAEAHAAAAAGGVEGGMWKALGGAGLSLSIRLVGFDRGRT